jgi:prepilin-type N-terminal cleavage/methylation domain-containing protein
MMLHAAERKTGKTMRMITSRRAVTLVELLVVIVILSILTAIAIPLMSPNNEQRKLRDASRSVIAFVNGARARAIGGDRSVGVRFEPMQTNANACMMLTYVEVPRPYPGDVMNATLIATITNFDSSSTPPKVTLTLQFTVSQFNYTMLKVGDTVRANNQWDFLITGPDSNNDGEIDDPTGNTLNLTSVYDLQTGQKPSDVFPFATVNDNGTPADPSDDVWAGSSGALSYAAMLQLAKSAGAPLQLPEGVVVDLRWSGESGASVIDPRRRKAPTIMFSPDGTVESVYSFDNSLGVVGGDDSRRPLGSIHFLIGKVEKALPGGDTSSSTGVYFNYQDPANYWVSINTQTGFAGIAEVAMWKDKDADNFRDQTGASATHETVEMGPASTWITDGHNSRAFAQSFQLMGGR